MTKRKIRLFFVMMALFTVAALSYAAEKMWDAHHSTAVRSGATKSQPSRITCVDEKGEVMNNNDGMLQYKCLDRKAQLAATGDPSSVRELADAVVVLGGVSAPDGLLNDFEERLTSAELRYRKQSSPGIAEQNVVTAANNLGQKLHAPAFAQTDGTEVTLLRADAASYMPHFIRAGNQPMSPLEATYLLRVLLYQKVYNETFLMTPDERRALTDKKVSLTETEGQIKHQPMSIHPRVKEMLALANKTATLRESDLIDLANELLNDLGIDR